jgi:hypothetical protein
MWGLNDSHFPRRGYLSGVARTEFVQSNGTAAPGEQRCGGLWAVGAGCVWKKNGEDRQSPAVSRWLAAKAKGVVMGSCQTLGRLS